MKSVVALVTSAGVADADKIVATDAAGRLDGSLMPGGAPVNASAGAGDAGKLPKLDASGKLDTTMMPSGVGAETMAVVTSENLAAGSMVNVYNNSGTLNARKADATSAGKRAHGFVLAATTSGQTATVYFDGTVTGLSGLTNGATYFLHTTAGGVTVTAPSATGNVVQPVGVASSATTLEFRPAEPVELA
jgi:hypothetical protein